MNKVWKKFYLGIATLMLFGPSTFAQSVDEARTAPKVLQAIAEAPDAYHPVLLLLEDRVDILALEQELLDRKAGLEERAYEVITRLQAKAAATQPALLARLEKLDGVKAGSIHPFWISNAIFVEANGPAIARLSQDKAVGQILPNDEVEIMDDCAERLAAPVQENSTERGLSTIGATQMWAMGYTGYGRKAMIIDTGEDAMHPALHNQFAYHTQELSESWASPGEPQYCSDHGSHVTGIIVGLDRLNRDTIGVAFNGQWMGGPVTLSGCNFSSNVLGIFQTFQWALNPDGNPSTTSDMPDVVNNSWGQPLPSAGDCGNSQYLPIINALMTAGVAVVFSAGNEGPGASTVGNPAMNNIDLVRVFSVGNLNAYNAALPINSGSSRGPSVCGGTGSLLIKPEVSAPGTNVRSSVPGGGYASFDGTSMAAPHVSGAVLLLKEAFPYLPGEEILLALYFSATDLGAPGEDNNYGMGLINLPAAYQYLIDQGHEPVPPVEAPNDVLLLQVEVRGLNCEEQVVARVLVENGGTEPITSLEFRHFLNGASSSPVFPYQWEGMIMPGERQYIQLPAITFEVGDFEYVVEASKANGEPDARRLNNQLKSDVRIVADELFDGQVSSNRDVCQGGQALLQALYDEPAVVRWYDQLLEGNLLAEGRNALLPVADESFTVYMEVSPLQKIGRETSEGNNGPFSSDSHGLVFDAYAPFTIKSVKVYTEEAGSRLLNLVDPNGNAFTKVVPMGVGEQRVELNLDVEPGEGWELKLRAGKPLQFNVGGSGYPYEIPNVLSIRRSTQSVVYYHYFYDWEIEFPYFCGRTPVEVDVLQTGNAPAVAFSPAEVEIDLSSGINEVAFTDESAGATFWLWDFGDGATSTMRNPTHAYADTGVYQVILTVIGQDGCASSASGTVTVTETGVSSVSGFAREYGMEVFPNPARELLYLTLDIPRARPAEVYLADMLGRPVWRQSVELSPGEALEIPVNQLPAGLYSVIVGLDGRRIARRVVVSR